MGVGKLPLRRPPVQQRTLGDRPAGGPLVGSALLVGRPVLPVGTDIIQIHNAVIVWPKPSAAVAPAEHRTRRTGTSGRSRNDQLVGGRQRRVGDL